MADAREILKKVLKQLDPQNDHEYMRYVALSDRIASIERELLSNRERAPRLEQLTKAECQAVAKVLWKENPNLTIKEISTHPYLRDPAITNAYRFPGERTIYDWIAEVDQRPKEKKQGRPPKQPK